MSNLRCLDALMTLGSRLARIVCALLKGDKLMHNPTPLETVMRLKELDRQATPKLIPMRARRQGASPVAALWATMITLLRRLRAVGIPGRVASEH